MSSRCGDWASILTLVVAFGAIGSGAATGQAPERRVEVVEERVDGDLAGERRVLRLVLVGEAAASAEESEDAGSRVVERSTASSAHNVFVIERGADLHGEAMVESAEPGVFRWAYRTAPAPGGAYLGVEILALTDALRDHFASPRGEGVLISDVEPGSPAAVAGLRAGDVVTRLGGRAVRSTHEFGRRVRALAVGEAVGIEVWRGGSSRSVEAVPVEIAPRIIELGQGGRLRRIEATAGEEIHVDVDGAAAEIREIVDSGAWRARVESLEEIDVAALERRIRELEAQLTRLSEERRRRQR
ncbi:MAG: PDZ domain-containing protein [Acidobacteria bacterium]|nr:MAG: PDZ domain-containing protein [Acidobacteriota bacterium]REK10125.1 MAG: PDZ domain-containing protein [Acidobacteriota bacterium]